MDKATKLAVLPVVFFQRQSWKPAPVLTSETLPKSPDFALEAASKSASPPSLDLTKTVSTAHSPKVVVSLLELAAVLHGILSFDPYQCRHIHEPVRCHYQGTQ